MFKSLDTVRVTNIDISVTELQLIQLFQNHRLRPLDWSLCHHRPGDFTRYQVATLSFADESDAKRAVSLDGSSLGNHRIRVDREFFGLTPLFSPNGAEIE
jgi:hypothetical protein